MREGEDVAYPVGSLLLLGEATHLIWEERAKELVEETGTAGISREDSLQASSTPGGLFSGFGAKKKNLAP